MARAQCLDLVYALLQEAGVGAAITLIRELHIVGRDGFTVVEQGILAQGEIVGPAVLGDGDRLGKAGRLNLAGHRLHDGIVECVHHHIRCDDPRAFRRIKPGWCERDMHRERQLARSASVGGQSGGSEAHGGQSQHVAS